MNKIYLKLLYKIFLTILMTVCTSICSAKIYYVSNNGNDSNTGLSNTLPWKTLSKVNSTDFNPGDQILFLCGNTFYGSLVINQSGTSGNPITFSSYGTGTNPVITGFTTVNNWTNLGNNIWESTYTVSQLSTCNMVTINGVNTAMGRYPNSNAPNGGYLTFQSHSGSSSITSSGLSGTPNWTGAEVAIRSANYKIERSIISSQSGGTLNFNAITSIPGDGNGFFIQNDIRTLDQQNEWYYNPTTNKIDIFSANQPVNVNVASIDILITVQANYLVFNNINFVGANSCALYSANQSPFSSNIIINNCSFNNIGISAYYGNNNNLTFQNNTIINSNGCAVSNGYGSNINILNNTVKNIGILPGMRTAFVTWPNPYSGSNSAVGCALVNNYTVENNTIQNTGYTAITFYGSSVLVQNNFVDTFCTVLDDGGGIYTFTGSQSSMSNQIINGNIVINGIGTPYGVANQFPAAGIYCDNNSSNVVVSNNSVANNFQLGIFLNGPTKNITLFGNTAFNNSQAQLRINYNSGLQSYGVNFYNNIFIAKAPQSSGQYAAYLNSMVNNIPLAATSDSNYYACPISDSLTFQVSQPSLYANNDFIMSLPLWQSFSGQDKHSKKSPEKITSLNDLQYYYNPTNVISTIPLSQPMIDIKGILYYDTLKLQPYSSAVLLKDYNPPKYSKEYITICNGSNYDGWTTSGTYNQYLKTVAGADSTVIVYLTVNPSYNIHQKITINSGENYLGWTKPGFYTRNLTTILGCDSTISIQLFVTVYTSQYKTICNGNNYNGWTSSGTYTSNYITNTGSDSIVTTYLKVNPSYNVLKYDTIITGQNYKGLTSTGTYISTLTTYLGCDSTITTNLTVLPPKTLIKHVSICNGSNYNGLTTSGTYTNNFVTKSGADSIVTIYLTVNPNYNIQLYDTIITGQNYKGLTSNGVDTNRLITVFGCDSTVITNLIVLPPITTEQSISICFGNSYKGWNKSGIYNQILTTKYGADSIVTTYLTVNPVYYTEDSVTIYSGQNYLGWTVSGNYTLSLNSKCGCDSEVIYHLFVLDPTSIQNDISNIDSFNDFKVYPNPTHGSFSVQYADIPISGTEIYIYNIYGKQIEHRLIEDGLAEFNISGNSDGIYIVKSILGKTEKTEKLLLINN